jgi:hypothetical protein
MIWWLGVVGASYESRLTDNSTCMMMKCGEEARYHSVPVYIDIIESNGNDLQHNFISSLSQL